MVLFSIEKPAFWDHPDAPGTEHVSYRRMWRTNFTVAVMVTMLPLVLLAALGLFQMNWLDQMEWGRQIRAAETALAGGRDYFDARIKEKTAALELAASFLPKTPNGLEMLLERLNRSVSGFSALALAGPDGAMAAAAGNWTLSGLDKAGLAGSLPILRLARDKSGGDSLLLGIRLNDGAGAPRVLAQVSNRDLLHAAEISRPWPQSSVFLVDQKGRVLAFAGAESKGSMPKAVAGKPPEHEDPDSGVMTAKLKMKGLPLWLESRTPLSSLPGHWSSIKAPFIIFMALCLFGMLVMIYRATVNQVTRLYRAHLEQAQVLREIVYTQKLASIGRLAAGVGHQINNPVSVINEKAGLLKDLVTYGQNNPDPERLAALVKDIQGMVRRIGGITHRLLSFAKHLPADVAPVDLGLLAKEVADFMVSDTADHNIAVEFNLPPEPVVIESDQSLMEQVLLNVCNNAVGAMDMGGRLTISLEDKGEEGVILKVADDGRGIDPEHLKHIFEPYFTTKGEMGCGLGLSITYGIVQKLGGEISVENREESGAVIMVKLPKRTPDAFFGGAEEWEGSQPGGGGGQKGIEA